MQEQLGHPILKEFIMALQQSTFSNTE